MVTESRIGNKRWRERGWVDRRKKAKLLLGSDSSEETDVKVMSSLISNHYQFFWLSVMIFIFYFQHF